MLSGDGASDHKTRRVVGMADSEPMGLHKYYFIGRGDGRASRSAPALCVAHALRDHGKSNVVCIGAVHDDAPGEETCVVRALGLGHSSRKAGVELVSDEHVGGQTTLLGRERRDAPLRIDAGVPATSPCAPRQ